MEKDDANAIIMIGGVLYFIGCTGLLTYWKTHNIIDTASAATLFLGLLIACVGILLINNYLFFKAVALIGIALILAFGLAWIVHLPAL
jgi:hypothetical protein